MIQIRHLLLILLLTLTSVSYGQKPFGKRFSVGFNQGYTMVDILSLKFVGHSRIELTCNLGKSFMVGLEGNYSYARFRGYTNKYGVGYIPTETPFWVQDPTIRDISGGLKLYYMRNRNAAGAPSGQYFVATVNYGIKNKLVRTETEAFPPNSTEKATYILLSNSSKVIEPSCIVSLGFGRNFLFKRRILFGYGLDFGVEVFSGVYDDFAFRHFMKPIIKIGYTF